MLEHSHICDKKWKQNESITRIPTLNNIWRHDDQSDISYLMDAKSWIFANAHWYGHQHMVIHTYKMQKSVFYSHINANCRLNDNNQQKQRTKKKTTRYSLFLCTQISNIEFQRQTQSFIHSVFIRGNYNWWLMKMNCNCREPVVNDCD